MSGIRRQAEHGESSFNHFLNYGRPATILKMQTWRVERGDVVFACLQVRTGDDVPPIQLPVDNSKFLMSRMGRSGWFHSKQTAGGLTFEIYSYRSRILVSVGFSEKFDSLSEFIENEFLDIRHIFITDIMPRLPLASGSTGIVWYPIIDIKRVRAISAKDNSGPDWLGDGVTSFRYRIFDSRSGRIGYARVSRFGTACLGLGYPIVQDIINMVYERVLYPARTGSHPLHGSAERAIAEGLSSFTAPTEMNIYMQKITLNIAVYALAFAIFFGVSQILIPDDAHALIKAAILLGAVLLTWGAGSVVNALRSRAWRR
ncbi:hypothetical protein [Mycolicibacterium cosmeticum]|uniref:Uncharacterized protein n=1 Tax=Mycolicibacterium cosmeticum TaxID=258533 RepID=W9AMF2_MYCCO|nr:hypothetical protein [Mycolicibacterium cosmeticum]CDO06904.1 hypothetical protein BN977_01699 [Mycolicibacterium cosmeticum]